MSAPRDSLPTARQTFACLAGFGVVAALLELIALALIKFGEGAFVFVPRAGLWMIPVFHIAVMSGTALVLRTIARAAPRLSSWSTVGTLGGAYVVLTTLLTFHPRLHYVAIVIAAAGVGVTMGRAFQTRSQYAQTARRITLGGAAVLLTIGIMPPAVSLLDPTLPASATRAGLPNVILIILDTVRGDHTNALGYARRTTPHLDRLGRRGVVFDHAVAPAPWTLPSHATALTGRWPSALSADWNSRLDATHPTLAELLSTAGYETAGFSANTRFVSYETGLDRGFDYFEDYRPSVARMFLSTSVGRFVASSRRLRGVVGSEWQLDRREARDIRLAFNEWTRQRDSTRPFFAFMNFLDAHHPYEPPAPYLGTFGGQVSNSVGVRLRQIAFPTSDFRTDPAGLDAMIRLYDESLAYLDAELNAMLEQLESTVPLENTVIIVTADHGEHFGEHGLVDHGNSLYYPLIHVPLIVYGSGIPAGERVSEPVTLRDLPATIIDLVGLEVGDPGPIPGTSLRPTWELEGYGGARISPALSMVTGLTDKPGNLPISRGDMAALLVDSLLIIRDGDCTYQIFNVDNDPDNRTDLFNADGRATAHLTILLDSLAPAESAGTHPCGNLTVQR